MSLKDLLTYTIKINKLFVLQCGITAWYIIVSTHNFIDPSYQSVKLTHNQGNIQSHHC